MQVFWGPHASVLGATCKCFGGHMQVFWLCIFNNIFICVIFLTKTLHKHIINLLQWPYRAHVITVAL